MAIYYLYIKQHSVTGLKYFGFTQKKNPFKYRGSGLYWGRHLKKHGNDIKTIEIFGFDNHDMCREFAIKFSIINNIAESSEWANLKSEDATNGGTLGSISRAKISAANKGLHKGKTYEEIYGQEKATELRKIRSKHFKNNNNKGSNNPMFGRKHSKELKEKLSKERSGSKHPTYGWKWITDGENNIKVPPSYLLEEGWWYGRSMPKGVDSPYHGTKIMNKDGKNHHIKIEKIDEYLNMGFEIGKVVNTLPHDLLRVLPPRN